MAVESSQNKVSGIRIWWIPLLILIGLGVGGFLIYRHHAATQQSTEDSKKDFKSRPTPVTAQAAKTDDVNVYLNAIGTVIPRNVVTIKSQVSGQLMRVLFTEGQYVKQGQLLAEVDARPYQVQLAQAQGQMAKDEALLKNAELDLERYKTLLSQDSVAKQQLDTQDALVRQYEGTIKTDQAQIDSAKLQLVYTRITAPISGRVGLRLVDPGNLVQQSDATGLLTIAQVKPVSVVFSVPQDNLSGLLAPMHNGDKLPVTVYARDQQTKLADGQLLSLDNQIDTTTGTVKLKAQFGNDDETLFPNQFVNVKVLINVLKDATVIPNSAVQRGAQGTFVYIAQADQTVSVKPIKVTVIEGEFSAIEGEVKPGDLVVTDGADKLREGAKIKLASNNESSQKGKHQGGWHKDGAGKDDADASGDHPHHHHHKPADE